MKRNKVILALLFVVVLTLSAVFASCGVMYNVSLVVDNDVYATVEVSISGDVKMPQNPTKTGYSFDGWYWDQGTWQKPFTIESWTNAPLSSDMRVYAKFTATHKHQVETWTVTAEPTCGKDGSRHGICAVCEEDITEKIPATGLHRFAGTVCQVCGFTTAFYDQDVTGINFSGKVT